MVWCGPFFLLGPALIACPLLVRLAFFRLCFIAIALIFYFAYGCVVSARGRPESSITASAALVAPMRRRLETARLVASGVARVVAGALTDRNSALRAHRACERRSSHGRPPRDPSENGPRPKTKRWLSIGSLVENSRPSC